MTSEQEPKTVRELYFYMDGRFDTIETDIKNMRKVTFWIGGITGAIFSGIVATLFKFIWR
jgi:hypothetical protein